MHSVLLPMDVWDAVIQGMGGQAEHALVQSLEREAVFRLENKNLRRQLEQSYSRLDQLQQLAEQMQKV